MKYIGSQVVYDFEVDHQDHAIVANGFVAHNCLQSWSFYVRDGKLHSMVTMRSNDAVQATFMNAVGFISLQRKIAIELNLDVGSYTHTAYSFHAYASCFNKLDSWTNDIKNKTLDDLTYNYEEFYKELMEECIPNIMKWVNEKKVEYGVL